jgi:hypothetical protein
VVRGCVKGATARDVRRLWGMSCDGRHFKALVNVLDRLGATAMAFRQSGGNERDLGFAIGRLHDEHAQARAVMPSCADCSATLASCKL